MNPDPATTPDRAANHLALVARWSDELAHEIKNPFHAMVINLELVKRRAGEDGDGARDRAEVVESELHRVHGLIDSLLKVARPWPATAAANTATVFSALLPIFRARTGLHHIDYAHEPTEGPASAAIPPADLALLIVNLMDNAIDAVAGRDGERRIRSSCSERDGGVEIRFSDSGPGFPDLEGDPFAAGVTGREGRAGLGLAVSRAIVEAAGGTVGVEESGGEAPGVGATVVVTLPG